MLSHSIGRRIVCVFLLFLTNPLVARAVTTFAGVGIIDGTLTSELTVENTGGMGAAAISQILESDVAGLPLGYVGKAKATAELGSLKSRVEGTHANPFLTSGVFSVLGFLDTITLFDDGSGGDPGTLHLEYTIDGSVDVVAGSFASLSLSLLNTDLPPLENLDDPDALNGIDTFGAHSESWFDPGADTSVVYDPDNLLVVELEIPITFGVPINYGATLMLMVFGEGTLDFSQTVEFTDASVTDGSGQEVTSASILSGSGLAYGNLRAIPEPSSALLFLLPVFAGLAGRRRVTRA